jgi:hypothetical protein
MKKLVVLFAVATLGLVACDKEDNSGTTTPPKTQKEMVIGEWKGDMSVFIVTAPQPIGNDTTVENLSYLNVNFKSDGTYTTDSLGYDPEVGTWDLVNSTFTLDSMDFDLQVLTDSKLQIGLDTTETFGGMVITTSITQSLKK